MEHTVRAVGQDLDNLAHDVAALGDLAVAQVRSAIDVFLRHDLKAASTVVRADDALDLQDAEIEKRAIRFIALRQPMADDLRRPIAAMKTAMQLERCGDLAKNIAKRVGRMAAAAEPTQAAGVAALGQLVADRLAAVISAFRQGDAQSAYNVWVRDTEVDERHEAVLQEIVAGMTSTPAFVADGTHLLFIAKNLERIGDHATNIAELVYYQITGGELADRPKL